MQQNNCLILNNSLHLYTSSHRHLAEPTLSAQSEKEKSVQMWGELSQSPAELLMTQSRFLLSLQSAYNRLTKPPRLVGTSAPSRHPADAQARLAGAACARSTVQTCVIRAGHSGRTSSLCPLVTLCPAFPTSWLHLPQGHIGGS